MALSKMCCTGNCVFFCVNILEMCCIFIQLYHTATPSDAYGFEQSSREYTLVEFGEMADEYKRNYFKKPLSVCVIYLKKRFKLRNKIQEITPDEVEQEFWRILALPEASVKVEYGADLQTGELGSGFPTTRTKDLSENDKVNENKHFFLLHVYFYRNIFILHGTSIISLAIINLSYDILMLIYQE